MQVFQNMYMNTTHTYVHQPLHCNNNVYLTSWSEIIKTHEKILNVCKISLGIAYCCTNNHDINKKKLKIFSCKTTFSIYEIKLDI